MSYDLILNTRERKPFLTREVVLTHFQRDHYTVEDNQFSYCNEDTGVYFTLGFNNGKDGAEDEEYEEGSRPRRPYLWFNINYFRPHTFALEAAEELSMLVQALDLVASDPQSEGMGDGEYSTEGFRRGWEAGNRFAIRAIGRMENKSPGRTPVLPAAANRSYWKWNYQRHLFGESLLDDDIGVFVPRVMFLDHGGRVCSMCVWPQLIPSAIPQVDFVLVMRDDLPEPFSGRWPTGLALTDWQTFHRAAAAFGTQCAPNDKDALPYLLLDYGEADNAPAELVRFVQDMPDHPERLTGLGADTILDEELVREYCPNLLSS